MGKYAAFASDAASAEAGLSLGDALAGLFERLWRDNEPEAVERIWRYVASQPGSFASEVLEVLDDAVDDPPHELAALLREHGGVSLYHNGGTPAQRPCTQEETVSWLRETRDRFRAVYEAERPAPSRRPGS